MPLNSEITVFAKTNYRNTEVPFGIKTDDRRRHMYIIGKTGMGKTTLMENMVIQDIHNGHGVAFLDPHGDSVQRILNSIPSSRINDVIYFNPADLEYPIAFNILESVDPKYKHLVASGLMGVFTKIWANMWSARMEYILNNTILALLDSPGNTLLGITRMYVDKKYRKKIVDNIKDPMVRAFWVDEFANYNEKYRTEAIAPIQNKVGQFLSAGIIRNIVGQPRSTIDLREIMDNRKIFIMDLSKGKIGEDNSALLGAMLTTKLQLAAMSRTDIPEAERKDFYFYVDEFQNFATESFATILSEARKYRLNLVVGHQYIAQLEQDKNTKVRDAIFGNVGTIIVFRVGAADAEFMETEFEPIFTPTDLVNLPKYSIILKLMINGVASEPFSAVTLPPNPNYFTSNGEKVIKVSRERYSNSVAEVEDKISRWMGAEYHQESAVLIGAEEKNVDAEASPASAEKPAISELPIMQLPVIQAAPAAVEPIWEITPKPQAQPVEQPIAETPSMKTERPAEEFVLAESPVINQVKPSSSSLEKDSTRSNNEHKNFNQDRRPNFDRRNDHRNDRRQTQRRQSDRRDHKPEKKNENPIWNTVASMRQEKAKQEEKKVGEVVQQIFQPQTQQQPKPVSPNQPKLETEVITEPPAPISTQTVPEPTPVQNVPIPVPPQRKILQPGQAQKF